MSWSVSYGSLYGFEKDEPVTTLGSPSREVIDKAREAAAVLIKNKIVGDRLDHEFLVSISGHENPEKRHTKGKSNDFVHISVTQKERK